MGKVIRNFCWHQNFVLKRLSVPALGLYRCIKSFMCSKSYFKEIVLKLATNGQSDKGFLLTSKFVPKGLSAPTLGLYTCIKALKYIPGPGVRSAFTGPLVLWFFTYYQPPDSIMSAQFHCNKLSCQTINRRVRKDFSSREVEFCHSTMLLKIWNMFLSDVPNSGRGLPRLPYRTKQWDVDFRNHLNNLNKTKPVIMCGDLNVAHLEIGEWNIHINTLISCFDWLIDWGLHFLALEKLIQKWPENSWKNYFFTAFLSSTCMLYFENKFMPCFYVLHSS